PVRLLRLPKGAPHAGDAGMERARRTRRRIGGAPTDAARRLGTDDCDRKRISNYPNLDGLLRDIHQMPGVAPTVHMDHIRNHYFRSHPTINPCGIVPIGPLPDSDAPHDRDRLGARSFATPDAPRAATCTTLAVPLRV